MPRNTNTKSRTAAQTAERGSQSMAAPAAQAQTTRVPFAGVTGNARPPEGEYDATFSGGKWAQPKKGGDAYIRGSYTISEGTPNPLDPTKDLGGKQCFTNYRVLDSEGEQWGKVFFKQDMITLGADPDIFDINPETGDPWDPTDEDAPGPELEAIMAEVYGAPCKITVEYQKDSEIFYNLRVKSADSV